MVENLKNQLHNLAELLENLTDEDYIKPISALNGGNIGAHSRHIIEFVQCLLEQYPLGQINYDLRSRNIEIETLKPVAISKIITLLKRFENKDKPLKHIFTNYDNQQEICSTTYFREVVYNVEHCIHHEALIKVALTELNKCHLTAHNFGVAPSTILAAN